MTIVTKKGDRGETSLASGERVSKASLRVETYGVLDELVSFLGLARSLVTEERIAAHIKTLQNDLSILGSELAQVKEDVKIKEENLKNIEEIIDQYEPRLKLGGFVIPGDTTPSAAIDVARSTCRRLERRMVELKETGEFDNPAALKYVNRLSDLLYIFARYV